MGAHSVPGHHPGRAATVTAGVAAALVTTATTGMLTGGTALASDGDGGSGHHHHHGEKSRSHGADAEQTSESADGFAQQTLCDVLGDVDLGGHGSCSSDDGDTPRHSGSDDSDTDADDDQASGLFGSTFPGQGGGEQTSSSGSHAAPAPAPEPAPKPTSSVPDRPTVQPIVAQPAGAAPAPAAPQVVPIAHGG